MSSAGIRPTVLKYMELIRFSHTIFALPFAALSAAWAWILTRRDSPTSSVHGIFLNWKSLLGIVVCMVAARSFAMAINRIVDREFDAKNPRTAQRHLPSGQLQVNHVVYFAFGCALLFVTGTLFFLPNFLPVLLSLPVLMFLAGYSLAKRWTVLVHLWLGIALGLAPLCTWIALRGPQVASDGFDILPAMLLGLGVMLWVTGFDIIYACQDSEIDRQLNLRSIPSWLNNRIALKVAALCHGLMLIPLAAIPYFCPGLQLSWIYLTGLVVVAFVLAYEHSIVSADDLQRVNVAFFQANAVVSLVILVVGVIDACHCPPWPL